MTTAIYFGCHAILAAFITALPLPWYGLLLLWLAAAFTLDKFFSVVANSAR